MGTALKFSQFDSYCKQQKEIQGCIVDTNLLLASSYEVHKFHDDASFIFEKLAEYNIPIFTNVTTRSEYIDLQRRIYITEALMDMISKESSWKISKDAYNKLRALRTWIDIQGKKDELPILADSRIKESKETFYAKSHSGKNGWLEICKYYLNGKLDSMWETIVENYGINYLELREDKSNLTIIEKVSWEKMCSISEATCLSSSDSMIINILKCSTLPFIISADYDIAYAILADQSTKVVFVPDNLYRNKIKKINI